MWKSCGIIREKDCSIWEVHPSGIIRKYKSKLLIKGSLDDGYPRTIVKKKSIYLHIVLLETFKPRPHPSLECDHRNGVKTDYSLENLRWVSKRLNESFKPTEGCYKQFNKFQVKQAGIYYGLFDTAKEAKEEYEYQKAIAQRYERERVIGLVMDTGLTRQESIEALNWDFRDYVM